MQSFQIGPNESGQRLDKFLHKYLPQAGAGFLYKMLRKKNITLNGKRAEGKELLQTGDQVAFFFSPETFAAFRGISETAGEYEKAYSALKGIQILYEDAHVLILNKPAGILTQKAQKEDLSLNEWLIGYLLQAGKVTETSLETFRPSVANRLDRNTSGMVLCGISLGGSQELAKLLRERTVKKYYRTFVKGKVNGCAHIKGLLSKDERTNRVTVSPLPAGESHCTVGRENLPPGKAAETMIETAYEPLQIFPDMTYLEVELISGKTHQIRAHLASIGHPLLGDPKYGDLNWNKKMQQKYGSKWQLLHAYRMEFPKLSGPLTGLSQRTVQAPLPGIYTRVLHKNTGTTKKTI